ncbi:MAG: hypothetical protein WBR29_01115 [Gammaproteobacteria bacterium]
MTYVLYYRTVIRLGKRLNRKPIIKTPFGYVQSSEPDAFKKSRAQKYVHAAQYYIRILKTFKKAQVPAIKMKSMIRGQIKWPSKKLQDGAFMMAEESQQLKTDIGVLESLYSMLQWYISYLNHLEIPEE